MIPNSVNVEISNYEIQPSLTYKLDLENKRIMGKVDNRDFIVYINAETGNEEDIFLIVNTPNGILTIYSSR